MTLFNFPGNSNGLVVDANGIAVVGGVNIADFPASFNTFVTVNNPGVAITRGSNNTFFGHAGYANTGSSNTGIGAFSGLSNTTGNNNTFIGGDAGRLNTTGFSNTFLGQSTGAANVTGAYNTFVGWGAGKVNTADDNSFFGVNAGVANTTGSGNVFFGEVSGTSNTIGGQNTYVGLFAGRYCTTASTNTIIGANNQDAAHTTGGANTLIGSGLTGYGNVLATVIISDGQNTKNLIMDSTNARFTAPVKPPSYTVAGLPGAANNVGSMCYATNGRKSGEAAAAGTGVPVFSNGVNWLCFYNNLQVTA